MYFLSKITDNDADLLRFCREMQLIQRGVKCPNCTLIMCDPYILRCAGSDYEEV